MNGTHAKEGEEAPSLLLLSRSRCGGHRSGMPLQTRAHSAHLRLTLHNNQYSDGKRERVIGICEEEAEALLLMGHDIAHISAFNWLVHIVGEFKSQFYIKCLLLRVAPRFHVVIE